MIKRSNGWNVVDSPFTIDGKTEECRILTGDQWLTCRRHNMFTAIWDNEFCDVAMVVREISEYETEETFYIYFYEGGEDE